MSRPAKARVKRDKHNTMIAYDRYTEYLSKLIYKTITPNELKDVEKFEAAHRKPELKFCPKCNAPVWTFLTPYRVAHDIEKCSGKFAAKS